MSDEKLENKHDEDKIGIELESFLDEGIKETSDAKPEPLSGGRIPVIRINDDFDDEDDYDYDDDYEDDYDEAYDSENRMDDGGREEYQPAFKRLRENRFSRSEEEFDEIDEDLDSEEENEFHEEKSKRRGRRHNALGLSGILAWRRRGQENTDRKGKPVRRRITWPRIRDFLIRMYHIRYVRISGLFVLLCILLAIIGSVVYHWEYKSCEILVEDSTEDTAACEYYNVGGNILKCSIDNAALCDSSNKRMWMVTYDMESPKVAICGKTIAIYDRKGTSIVICNEKGLMGNATAEKPILKAKVSEKGTVAAILEDGDDGWISYMNYDGSEIASVKTTMGSNGYPMDLALSADGILLEVNYEYADGTIPCGRVDFYNFGSVGQNQMDNRVSSYEYKDIIMPQAEYLKDNACVVFKSDGFVLFGGGQIPEEKAVVSLDEKILSVFHDDEYIGLVTDHSGTQGEEPYAVHIYNRKGKEVHTFTTDYGYDEVSIYDGYITMSNRNSFCVFNLGGVTKYNGNTEGAVQQNVPIGDKKFVYRTELTFYIVRLH